MVCQMPFLESVLCSTAYQSMFEGLFFYIGIHILFILTVFKHVAYTSCMHACLGL